MAWRSNHAERLGFLVARYDRLGRERGLRELVDG